MNNDERNLHVRRPKGKDSWDGHWTRYEIEQGMLKTLIAFAEAKKCKVPERAKCWSTAAPPAKPDQTVIPCQ